MGNSHETLYKCGKSSTFAEQNKVTIHNEIIEYMFAINHLTFYLFLICLYNNAAKSSGNGE